MFGSCLSWEATVWYPMAGPPVRTSMVTPVSLPPEATSGPRTTFFDESIVGLSPTRLYRSPCSASGNQSVWMMTLSGQTPLRFTSPVAAPPEAVVLAPPAAVVVDDESLSSPPQAVARTASASGTAHSARLRCFTMHAPFAVCLGWYVTSKARPTDDGRCRTAIARVR